MNLNKVTLAGNLTRDPELKYTPKGTAVVVFGLAINRRWRTEGGEDKEETTFIDITAFARTAENIAKYFSKGRCIYIEGRLRLEQWEDKQTQKPRSKLSVLADSFQFVGGKDDGAPAPMRGANTGQPYNPPKQPELPAAGGKPPEEDPDSIPF